MWQTASASGMPRLSESTGGDASLKKAARERSLDRAVPQQSDASAYLRLPFQGPAFLLPDRWREEDRIRSVVS